jgi:hypothetical protein
VGETRNANTVNLINSQRGNNQHIVRSRSEDEIKVHL